MKNKLFILLTILLASTLLTACSSNKTKNVKEDLLGIDFNTDSNEAELSQYKTENPVVAMYIKNYGTIVIELYPDIAPNTVANFISQIGRAHV